MNEPQIWTLIGVFAASMLGMVSLSTAQFSRVIRTEIGRLDIKIDALDIKIDAKIDALEARLTGKIDTLDAKLTARIDTLDSEVSARIDTLDREVTDIATRFFGPS